MLEFCTHPKSFPPRRAARRAAPAHGPPLAGPAQNRSKIVPKLASFLAFNFGRFSAPFWSPFSTKIAKMLILKYAFRVRHPLKIEPLSQNALQKKVLQNRLKNCLMFNSFWSSF